MSLEITLTGQLAAEADGNRADATDLPGRQASMVFAYLVAERDRPVPSEELGEVAVDVELAQGEAEAARRALGAGQFDRALAAAGRARTIAGRPLLPGHENAWVEDRRAALHRLLASCLELQVDAHLAAGQAPLAVGPATDLVALEPFRDSAHRRLLAAHRAAGDRGEALRVYDRYRRVLAEELGVGPSPELEAAYLELLHAEPASEAPVAGARVPAAGAADGPPAPAPVPGHFVGRRPEL